MSPPPHDITHRQVQELLPWWINETLDAEECREVERHLAHCPECRREEARCRDVARWVRDAEEVAPIPHPAHVERLLEAARVGSARGLLGSLRMPCWLRKTSVAARWVLAAQLALVLALLGVVASRDQATQGSAQVPAAAGEGPAFRTLAATETTGPGPRLRVVFRPGTTEEQIRGVLLQLRAEIVGGPSPLGAYVIQLSGGGEADPLPVVLEHLRGLPEVRFSEPVAGNAGGSDDD